VKRETRAIRTHSGHRVTDFVAIREWVVGDNSLECASLVVLWPVAAGRGQVRLSLAKECGAQHVKQQEQ
jgi:hypothetical protein